MWSYSITAFIMSKMVESDSRWRYDTLYGLMKQSFQQTPHISFHTARQLIDFLNPNGEYPETHGYYAPGTPMEGHVAIMSNDELVIEGLFGYYGSSREERNPWVRLNLQAFQ